MPTRTARITRKAAELTATAVKGTAKLAGKGIVSGVKSTYGHRKEIAGGVVGVATGTAKVVHATSGHLISPKRLAKEVEAVNQQSRQYERLKGTMKQQLSDASRDRACLLDTLIVGGASMASYLNASALPSEIQQAYEMAYPHVAAAKDFAEQVSSLDAAGLIGFASGIKGKLFEMQYVDYLNNGNLEAGYTAALSMNPVNPGWDIAVTGPDGAVGELIQAKATDSVSYVLEALRENPQIDVVTTTEVYSQLVMLGFSESVIDGGISEAALSQLVDSGVGDATVSMDWMPSAVALALIAYSSYSQENLSRYQQSKEFGDRSMRSYLCYLVGGSLAVATNTWWLGVIGGMGTRFVMGSGKKKIERLQQLKSLRKGNQVVLHRLEAHCP
jgi:hypothetical protein